MTSSSLDVQMEGLRERNVVPQTNKSGSSDTSNEQETPQTDEDVGKEKKILGRTPDGTS
jgi:hypothetical protein